MRDMRFLHGCLGLWTLRRPFDSYVGMKTILILLPILFVLNVLADDSKPLVLPEMPKPETAAKKKLTVDMSCTSGSQKIKKDDPGFETCMADAQSTATSRRNNSKETGASQNGAEPSVNFQFGK